MTSLSNMRGRLTPLGPSQRYKMFRGLMRTQHYDIGSLRKNHSTMILRGTGRALNWAPIMSRHASLSDGRCDKTVIVRLVPNQSEKGKYNLISVWCNRISKKCLWIDWIINHDADYCHEKVSWKLKRRQSDICPIHSPTHEELITNLQLFVVVKWTR